jgi:hypothetical protein
MIYQQEYAPEAAAVQISRVGNRPLSPDALLAPLKIAEHSSHML